MDALKPIDPKALFKLKAYQGKLTPQQYKTLRGQILAGDADGAMRGLQKLMARRREWCDHKTR